MLIERTWQKLKIKLKQFSLKEVNCAVASCPAHQDQRPSLSIEKKKGIILLKCHAGCSFREIVEALGMSSNEFNTRKKTFQHKKEVCRYAYHDKNGDILGFIVKFYPKKFSRLRVIKGKNEWNWNGIQLVPYNLPLLLKANQKNESIFIVEGEKDADNLNHLGFTATTFPGGAGKWRDSYKSHFIGSDLILIPDNDQAGIKGMEKIAENLSPVTKRLRIIYLKDLNEKDDISDWLEINGFKKNRFEKLINSEAIEWDDLKHSKKATTQSSIDGLNEEFAVLTMGNKVLILWEKNDEERFLPVQDFRVKLKNKWVDQQKASEYFLESEGER